MRSVSFDIPKGQIIGLLGHNGAGKTTTLKMLTGYLEATEGQIHIGGQNINDDLLGIQAKIGYLPEHSPLYDEMTVVQYLDYVGQMRGISDEMRPAAIKDAVSATDLEGKLFEQVRTLSKGFRQRVGVAQAIIHKPEILILDEPTNGLDPTQILAMRKLILKLAETSTVILSTHIMQEVEAVCDRVLIILNGELVVDSMLSELQKANTVKLSIKEDFNSLNELIGSMNGVKEIRMGAESGGVNTYNIETEKGNEDLIPMIANAVVSKGWGLYQLQREHRDLESIFRDVNGNRTEAKGAAHV